MSGERPSRARLAFVLAGLCSALGAGLAARGCGTEPALSLRAVTLPWPTLIAAAAPKPADPPGGDAPSAGAGGGDDDEPFMLDPELDPRSFDVEGGSQRALSEAGEARVADLVGHYRERAHYPPWSYVVPAGRDPVAEAARAPKARAPLPDGKQLVVSLSSWSLTPEETLSIKASLRDAEDRVVKARSGRASLVNTAATGYLAHVSLAAAKDGTLSGTWKAPNAETVTGDPGVHRLQVIATSATGEAFEAQTDVLITVPRVQLTRRYRDKVVDGNLVIEVGLSATQQVRAHLSATLAPVSALSGPRAFAQRAIVIEPGKSFAELVFYGRVLHALGAPGPYRITSLVVQDTSVFPPARLPLQEGPHTTSPYPLSAFHNDSFGQKDLLELADFLENR